MIYLNSQDNPITLNKKQYLLRAQERMGLEVFGDSDEYVLNIEPCEFKFGSKWTGLWHIDNLVGDRKYYEYDLFDTVFTADLSYDKKAVLLLQALDPELHRRIPSIKQDVDFVMSCSLTHINNIWLQRQLAYATLKKNFTWVDLDKGHEPEEYIRGLNRAKVQFIQSMEVNGRGEIAQRFFECLGIGPVLTNKVEELKHTGLIEGEDYMSYRNMTEAIDKMKYLLSHDKERKEMAEKGRKKALMHHSYEHRLISILNTINEI